LQGARATTNILNISKLTENHLITKNTHTMFIPFAKGHVQSSAVLDDF